jgi:DNA-directed RNA polymerase subunit H (RpoH/RPB5)
MHISAMLASLLVLLALSITPPQSANLKPSQPAQQLFAVRGEVVKIKPEGSNRLLITVRPAKEFPEVTVLARENELVGSAVKRGSGVDLFGLFSDDDREDETITAAELAEGDVVSVIYDPAHENRSLEIYLH